MMHGTGLVCGVGQEELVNLARKADLLMTRSKTFYEEEMDRISGKHGLPSYLYTYIWQSTMFMEKHHAEQIELKTISAAAFMSRFHFIRIFRQVHGLTPRQYLRDVRIRNAQALLKLGRPVYDVCLEVGYNSLPTFSNAFKRGTGKSPAEFQQLNSNPE